MLDHRLGPLLHRTQLLVRAGVLLIVLGLFSHFYVPGAGFTALIHFSRHGHSSELPVVQRLAHYDHPGGAAYDGQFYAQLAIVPLLTDPAIDLAMDNAPYRARRILASWAAYLAGLGDPASILAAYATQNLVLLVVLGLLLNRTFPPTGWRETAAWTACMLAPGLMTSVRYALPEVVGAALTVAAVLAVQSRRLWLAACMVGLAGLVRETFLLGIPMLWLISERRLARSAALTALAVLPFLLWQDYLYSIYRAGGLTAAGHVGNAGSAYLREASVMFHDMMRDWWGSGWITAAIATSMLIQLAFVVSRLAWTSPWWWAGSATAGLMALVTPTVWVGSPRVFLPLAFAFNALLPRGSRWFWPLFAAGNLYALVTIDILVVPWWHGWR